MDYYPNCVHTVRTMGTERATVEMYPNAHFQYRGIYNPLILYRGEASSPQTAIPPPLCGSSSLARYCGPGCRTAVARVSAHQLCRDAYSSANSGIETEKRIVAISVP